MVNPVKVHLVQHLDLMVPQILPVELQNHHLKTRKLYENGAWDDLKLDTIEMTSRDRKSDHRPMFILHGMIFHVSRTPYTPEILNGARMEEF